MEDFAVEDIVVAGGGGDSAGRRIA
jgi:hypothetical protein